MRRRWSTVGASVCVSLVRPQLRRVGTGWFCLLDSGRELVFSLLDLQDASSLELASCAA